MVWPGCGAVEPLTLTAVQGRSFEFDEKSDNWRERTPSCATAAFWKAVTSPRWNHPPTPPSSKENLIELGGAFEDEFGLPAGGRLTPPAETVPTEPAGGLDDGARTGAVGGAGVGVDVAEFWAGALDEGLGAGGLLAGEAVTAGVAVTAGRRATDSPADPAQWRARAAPVPLLNSETSAA